MRPLILLAPLLVLAVAAPVAAQQIYKWKDAKGVTHYSEKPPAQGNYSTHESVRDPMASAPAAAGSPAPSRDDSRCDTARGNLAALQGGGPLQFDSDGDGKADRELNDAERQSQANMARATLEAYNCTETAAQTPATGQS